jgi:hypothetical protein
MSREAAIRRTKARRKAARLARAEPAAAGLRNHDQRRLQASAGARKRPKRRISTDFRHLAIAVLTAAAVMAVIGAALGLVPAIEAASADGTVGTFVVGSQPCISHRGGCAYTGTFEMPGGGVISHVAYEGGLPPDAGGGSRIPARYTGYQQAYPVHSSRTWVEDLIIMALIGSVAGFLVWLLPVGLGQRPAGPGSGPGPRGAEL